MKTEDILEKIKETRKEKKISLREMGEALGISVSYYSLIEKGKSSLKLETYLKICEIFHLSPQGLMQKDSHKIECWGLVEEIENLPNREYLLMRHFLQLLKTPIEEL